MSKSSFTIVGNQRISRRDNGTYLVEHINTEKSMTQQCFAEMADINRIMSRWLNGNGADPHQIPDFTRYRDVSDGRSFGDVMNLVCEAQSDFDSLPADVRSRFKNDPANLVAFVSDPANTKECIDLGILVDDSGLGANLVGGVGGDTGSPGEQLPLDVTVRTDTAVVS